MTVKPTITLKVLDTGETKTVEAETGELLSQVTYRSGIELFTTCGGKAACTDCRVRIEEGLDTGFEKPEGPEVRILGNVFHLTRERLACQAKIKGDSVVVVPVQARRKTNQRK